MDRRVGEIVFNGVIGFLLAAIITSIAFAVILVFAPEWLGFLR